MILFHIFKPFLLKLFGITPTTLRHQHGNVRNDLRFQLKMHKAR